jgi:prephenate dehydrogenase
MMIEKRLCIVGLGLMGGSLGQALREHAAYVVGVDRHAATRRQALADGVVDFATADLSAALDQTDVLLLATPVKSILNILEQLPSLKPDGCMVMDIGSTKLAINETMSQLPPSFSAIGGHPMCGKEVAGYQAADPEMFRGAAFILTRSRRTTQEIEELALSIIKLLGAKPMFLSAQRHDQVTAAVSHLPYVVSAALTRAVSKQHEQALWQISASGFRDSTRLAGSDPQMLLDILLTNRTAVLENLQIYKRELEAVIGMIEEEDEASLAAWLSEAQRQHIAYRQEKDASG